ncbi:YtxH domain-containing protein [Oceanihabitans sediminis]|nr:YtxH domain-containing protein [Oceanihabitans sediminis]MDX1277471.1 YtxH domain-containing protein [Oceanihabitans sediminis]MDX1772812.1 YtxH domain-containing protein [Oceanihabitans sediminis]RBP34490.1 putative membrane protein [Oceanihabitans sediminis]
MSDNKKFSDDLDDMLGDAKEGAKKAADKAGDFAEGAKEKAKEFANEFSEDAKKVLADGKNVAIIAHITPIGWIIALVMNSGEKKNEYASFYIRQVLGLGILSLLSSLIPGIGWAISIIFTVLWILSLIGALSDEKKPTPILGEKFQEWFKSL